MASSDGAGHHQIDANALLSFTSDLHVIRQRVEGARVSSEQRHRWQSRLAAISRGAADDLQRAITQLRRMSADLDRHGV